MSEIAVQDVLVRKIEISVVEKLKEKAKKQNRSLQAEMQIALRDAADKPEASSALEVARKIRASIKNRNQTDSVILLRELREARNR